MDFNVFNNSKGDSFYNLTFTLKRDVRKVLLCFDLKGKSDANDDDYSKRIFRVNIDTCSWREGMPFRNYIVDFLVEKIQKFSNFRFECPQKKKTFYIHNSPAPDDNNLFDPIIFRRSFGNWEMTINVGLKVTTKANAIRGFVITVRGQTDKSKAK